MLTLAAAAAVARIAHAAFSSPSFGNPPAETMRLAFAVGARAARGDDAEQVSADAERLATRLRLGRAAGIVDFDTAALAVALADVRPAGSGNGGAALRAAA